MHKLNDNASTEEGFTLIEVMIAVLVFAVITSIIFPAMVQFLDVRERIMAKQEHLSQLQKTFLFMERDLRFAANRLGKDSYGEAEDAPIVVTDGDVLFSVTAAYPDLNLRGAAVK